MKTYDYVLIPIAVSMGIWLGCACVYATTLPQSDPTRRALVVIFNLCAYPGIVAFCALGVVLFWSLLRDFCK